ncbi:Uncharacterised protein [uncultured archaeon]|nr:Uncharacterised protein [uncultured archaeon]
MAEVKFAEGKKRGILFTVSIMLLSISLLSFAMALSDQAAKSKRAATALADIDRITDIYSNMEDEIGDIVSESANMSVANGTVYLNASLPYSPQVATDLGNFAAFEANATEQDIAVRMNLTNAKAGTFLIQPGSTEITQSPGAFYITPKNTAEGAGSLSSYDVSLMFPSASADGAFWDVVASGDNATGVLVHVRVQDASYATNLDFYETLDKYRTSRLNITQGGATVGYVQFESPGKLGVHYADNMGLKASVGFSNPVYVEANDNISIAGAVNMTGRVRMA